MLRGHKTSCNERENSHRTEQNTSLIWHILVLLEFTNLKVYIYPLPHISSSLPAGPAYPFFPFSAAAVAGLFLFTCSGSCSPTLVSALSTHSDYICLLQMIIFPSASQLQIPITVYPALNLFFIEFHQHKAIVNTSV